MSLLSIKPTDLCCRIPPSWDSDGDYSELKSTKISTWANHELNVLEDLTERGSSCTPKLLDYALEAQRENEHVPGGYIVFILMERLPGRNLTNFDTFPLEKRDEVRIAFGKAIRYSIFLTALSDFLLNYIS